MITIVMSPEPIPQVIVANMVKVWTNSVQFLD